MTRNILLRVAAPTVVVGLLLMSACLVSVWYINHLQTNLANLLKEEVAGVRAAEQMEINVRQLRFLCFQYLILPTDDLLNNITENEVRFEEWLEKADAASVSDREKAAIAQIRQGYDRHRQEFGRMSEQARIKPRRDFRTIVDKELKQNVIEPCRTLLAENVAAMKETAEQSDQLAGNLRLAMILLGILGPIGGVVCGYGIARGLSRSLYRLSVQVQDMAKQFDEEVASVKVSAADDFRQADGPLWDIVRKVEQVTRNIQKQQHDLFRAEQLATVGKLAACVAHEIRNPLAAMKLLVSVSLRPRNRKPLTEEDLRVIHDEIGRLEQTAQNLLDFARVTPPERKPCDLRDVVQQALELVRARASLQGVEISAILPEAPVAAEVDRSQWRTVLINLFFNALDAMSKGGKLEVQLEHRTSGEVALSVSDTGIGITPSVQDGLFVPFTSGKPSGTGLGLSISRRVVEQHGGRISAANRPAAQGTGACFLITLPVVQPAEPDGLGISPPLLAVSSN